MNTKLINRLCLGTAQFGFDYGIANKRGRISEGEVFRILKHAQNSGLHTLDTAYSYGESENVIGKVIGKVKYHFKIISKLPAVNGLNSEKTEKIVYESLRRLKIKNIYGYLVHQFDDFLKYDELWKTLSRLKKEKIIRNIGFSLYHPRELEIILEKKVKFDLLQIPYSIFDRRFAVYFKFLKKKEIEIHARSVFLQGLVFLRPEKLSPALINAKPFLERLHSLAQDNRASVNSICLNFALLNPYVDKVVMGIDNLGHLKKNIEETRCLATTRSIHKELEALRSRDEDIILPYNWKMR